MLRMGFVKDRDRNIITGTIRAITAMVTKRAVNSIVRTGDMIALLGITSARLQGV
jgi:hypothetical protein